MAELNEKKQKCLKNVSNIENLKQKNKDLIKSMNTQQKEYMNQLEIDEIQIMAANQSLFKLKEEAEK